MLRFEIRKEFFGCLIQDLKKFKTYLFDEESTQILEELLKKDLQKVYSKYEGGEKFFDKIKSIGLLKNNKINYYFIKNKPLPNTLSAPIRVHYAITAKCNLYCKHCFTRDILSRREKELTYNEKINLLENLQKMGIHEMLISGGEPFLTPRFKEFIIEAAKRKINVKIFSNGLIFNNKIIEEIKDLPISYLAISVDGTKQRTISKIRGKINFKKLKENILKLTRKCKYPIVMQITVTRYNLKEIKRYIDLAKKLNIERIKIRALKPGGAVLKNTDMMISAKEYLNFCLSFHRHFNEEVLNKKGGISMDATLGNTRLIYNPSKDKLLLENLPQPYTGFGCVGGRITLFIDSFGYCHPCAFIGSFLDINNGENIKKKGLEKIWLKNRNLVKMRTLNGNRKCQTCKLYNLCRGDAEQDLYFITKLKI